MLKTKILFYISFCILFTSCAAIPNLGTKKEENSYGNTINYFLFKDVSGQYIVKREKPYIGAFPSSKAKFHFFFFCTVL